MTERYAVLIEHPYTVNPLKIPLSNKPFIENFELGARARHAVRRVRPPTAARHVGDWHGDPFFVFHNVNAFEDGDDIVIDLCAYDDRRDRPGAGPAAPARRRAGPEVLPRALPRCGPAARSSARGSATSRSSCRASTTAASTARPYRYVWGTGARAAASSTPIVKVDVTTGETLTWSDGYPGEPVYVGRPGARGGRRRAAQRRARARARRLLDGRARRGDADGAGPRARARTTSRSASTASSARRSIDGQPPALPVDTSSNLSSSKSAARIALMATRSGDELNELESRQEPRLVKALEMVAPGTALREGIDNILHARTGGLLVIGEPEELASSSPAASSSTSTTRPRCSTRWRRWTARSPAAPTRRRSRWPTSS